MEGKPTKPAEHYLAKASKAKRTAKNPTKTLPTKSRADITAAVLGAWIFLLLACRFGFGGGFAVAS